MDFNAALPVISGFVSGIVVAVLGYLVKLRDERRKDMALEAEKERIDRQQRVTLYEISDDTIRNRFAWLEERFDRQEVRISELEQEVMTKEQELIVMRRENVELKWQIERRDARIVELESQIIKLQGEIDKIKKHGTGPLRLGPAP